MALLQLGDGLSVHAASQQSNQTGGILPYLSFAAPLYVESAYYLSDNDPDHWPAFWLMPNEHDSKQSDVVPGDPPKMEKWVEPDIDEGSMTPASGLGSNNAVHCWSGIYPAYTRTSQQVGQNTPEIDRTLEHRIGFGWDGTNMTWYRDDVLVFTAPKVPVWPNFASHHYYLIHSAQTKAAKKPYQMMVRYSSAWVK
jgi:beta-glucanase (GH16 family)